MMNNPELWHKSPDSNICWFEYLKQLIFSDFEFGKLDLDLICMLCWFDVDLIVNFADLICDLKKSKLVADFFQPWNLKNELITMNTL